jgi:hypothetical protein
MGKRTNKAEEAVRKGDIRELYNIKRKLYKTKYHGMQPIKTRDGALLTNEDDQMKRWQEYFKQILNPIVKQIISTTSPSSPTDRCDNEAQKDEQEKVMERPPN